MPPKLFGKQSEIFIQIATAMVPVVYGISQHILSKRVYLNISKVNMNQVKPKGTRQIKKKPDSVSTIWKPMLLLAALCVFSCQNKTEAPEPLTMREAADRFKLTEIEEIHLAGDSSHIIGVVTSFKIASNGNFYLNDESSSTVQVYSPDGNFLFQMGKHGQGPGEFQLNKTIRLAQDRVGVMDVGGRKITFFDHEANYLNDMRLVIKPGILVLGDQFDFSPTGSRIYVNCIDANLKPDEIYKKSFIIAEFNENLKPVSMWGEMDPIIQSFGSNFTPDAIIRTDGSGNIYVVHKRLPKITKYSSAIDKLRTYNFYTEAWNHPYDNLNANISTIDLEAISHSEVFEMEIGKKTGRIFIGHGWKEMKNATKKQREIFPYLSVLSPVDELLISAQKIVLSPIAINDDEDVFLIKDYTSTGCIIGKYRLTPLK